MIRLHWRTCFLQRDAIPSRAHTRISPNRCTLREGEGPAPLLFRATRPCKSVIDAGNYSGSKVAVSRGGVEQAFMRKVPRHRLQNVPTHPLHFGFPVKPLSPDPRPWIGNSTVLSVAAPSLPPFPAFPAVGDHRRFDLYLLVSQATSAALTNCPQLASKLFEQETH
jgi:hypothetical protein